MKIHNEVVGKFKIKAKRKIRKRYRLTVNAMQAEHISRALETYARLGIGQLEACDNALWHFAEKEKVLFFKIGEALKKVKPILGLQENSSHGILSKEVPDMFRSCWDMYQVIRHKISWDEHPEGGNGVNFRTPMVTSEMPLIKIENERCF